MRFSQLKSKKQVDGDILRVSYKNHAFQNLMYLAIITTLSQLQILGITGNRKFVLALLHFLTIIINPAFKLSGMQLLEFQFFKKIIMVSLECVIFNIKPNSDSPPY